MEKFTVLNALVVPLDRANVDTDAIIPKQYLKSIKRSGYGPNLFDAWRYLDIGQPGMDDAKRPLNPDFVLNQPRYRGAQILLARTAAAEVLASTRPGRFSSTASSASSRRRTATFSTTTASRTGSCR